MSRAGEEKAAKLILCGTPIGNLEDLSHRQERTLREAELIACEDTRRTRQLLAHLGIKAPRLISYHEGNERRQVPKLLAELEQGTPVVLVSDAGMPGLSDPGYRLVVAAVEREIPIEVVPGPSAAVAALAVAGLPPQRFCFEGFLPRRRQQRRKRIEGLREEQRTMIFYESPHRIEESLEDLSELLGERQAVLARELTKLFEEVRRGTLGGLLQGVRQDPPRGEIVLVIEGKAGEPGGHVPPEELARRARELMARGVSRREAMQQVARDQGVARRQVFDALASGKDSGG